MRVFSVIGVKNISRGFILHGNLYQLVDGFDLSNYSAICEQFENKFIQNIYSTCSGCCHTSECRFVSLKVKVPAPLSRSS